MTESILITGGSGLIGRSLSELLEKRGYNVCWLTREKSGKSAFQEYEWNPGKGTIDEEALLKADHIIHLAGAPLNGKRWNKKVKRFLRDSRIQTAELLYTACERLGKFPKSVITMSASGYYGYDTGDVWKSEQDPPGDDFLATLVKDWEAAACKFQSAGTRVGMARTGVVLSSKGGILPIMAAPVKIGFGAALGRGNQYMSWIHEKDLVNAFVFLLEKELEGPWNMVAPGPVTNRETTLEIARLLKRKILLPNVPPFVLRVIVGEMAEAVLGSSRVSPAKLEKEGFIFEFPRLEEALSDLMRK